MNSFSTIINALIEQIKPNRVDEAELALIREILNRLFAAMEQGDSCIELSSEQALIALTKAQLAEVVATEKLPSLPLSIYATNALNYLYLTRYYYYEQDINQIVRKLCASSFSTTLERTQLALKELAEKSQQFDFPNKDQYHSIQQSVARKFSIITGGPGTGKTTSVVLILWSLYQIYGDSLKVLIGAPTGKAAKRVKESLQSNIDGIKNNLHLDVSSIQALINSADSFGTIHKLLGYNHQSIYFRHNSSNCLDTDVLIIDESSMIGLPLFQKLISAVDIAKIKHVIFLGDPNQLSSVEEGFVFNSLVNATLADKYVSNLSISKRNQGDVGRLANAILQDEETTTLNILNHSQTIRVKKPSLNNIMHSVLQGSNNIFEFIDYCQHLQTTPNIDLSKLYKKYTQCTVLCMTNIGKLGVTNLNYEIENSIKQRLASSESWYSGRSVIILENEKSLNLFNGDIGICIMQDGKPCIYFDDGRDFIPEVLPKHQLSYAITIHKSQGSEYDMVKIIIPSVDNHNLLSKELVYTGITRAKNNVELFSLPEKILTAKKTIRVSCLRTMLG